MPPRKKPSTGVNQAAAAALRNRPPSSAAQPPPPSPAPPTRPTPRAKPKAAKRVATKRSARTAAAPTRPATPAESPASASASSQSADLAANLYAGMAWALRDPELGPVLTKAAQEGWDKNRLRGAVLGTNWFKVNGTAKVAAVLKEKADSYLVPLDETSRREFAFKIITGETQPAQFEDYLRNVAKSSFPTLAPGIDQGYTVAALASPFRTKAAELLETTPDLIDLTQPKFRRVLEGKVDEKGQRVPMAMYEWETLLKTGSEYGYDLTKGARAEASAFAAKLQETFGAR